MTEVTVTERRLATIRRIAALDPIPGADKIVRATVDGWELVTAIDNGFKVGDLVVYLEIDSWVPFELAPFLTKGKEPKVFNGVPGEKLRTIRLRGQVSQGLILPFEGEGAPKVVRDWAMKQLFPATQDADFTGQYEGSDLTEALGIQKWERPLPAELAGMAKGGLPGGIPKTDEERIQNLTRQLPKWIEAGYTFEVSEKLDGSSMTAYLIDGEFGVCSRNLDLKESETNAFWEAARAQKLEETLRDIGENLALQGELVGDGVQKNRYGLTGRKFFLFRVYDIDAKRYFTTAERNAMVEGHELTHVPVMNPEVAGTVFVDGATVANILQMAEGKSVLNDKVEREGLVFKCVEDPQIHFKAISNKYLLEGGE